jgi:hypothetical protein
MGRFRRFHTNQFKTTFYFPMECRLCLSGREKLRIRVWIEEMRNGRGGEALKRIKEDKKTDEMNRVDCHLSWFHSPPISRIEACTVVKK